jgi:hypothetical protein
LRWSTKFALVVIAACIVTAFVGPYLADTVWVGRISLFGSYALGTFVFLRGSGVWLRDVALIVVLALVGAALFKYGTSGPTRDAGETACFMVPWLIAIGVGRWVVLGTLAPGRYGALPPADEKLLGHFRDAWAEIQRARYARSGVEHTAHLDRAYELVAIETDDPDWIELKDLSRAFIAYDRGDEGEPDPDEYSRRWEAYLAKLRLIQSSRRVWYGRFGRPTARAAQTT